MTDSRLKGREKIVVIVASDSSTLW